MAPKKAVIRPVERRDVDVLFEMICALADHEKEREFLIATPEKLAASGFGQNPAWQGLIAEIDSAAAGYATYTNDYHLWSASPRMTLDDLYVRPEYRSRGLGEQLVKKIFEIATEKGAAVSWTVQTDNDRAIAFYKKLGARYRVTGKCYWRPPHA